MKEFIDEYKKLLPLGKSISAAEAERRASKFLEAMATIADLKHEFTKAKIKDLSVQTAVYAEQLAKGTGKTVTENKTAAEASKEYTEARETLESTDNDISYLKTYYEIFHDAHILYRTLAKGESFG